MAFTLAARRPELVERLAVLNGPHPALLARELRRNPRQLLRSAYVVLFVLPWLPERVLAARGGALVGRLVQAATRRPGTWRHGDLADYGAAMARPGRAAAALGYYRAAVRHPRRFLRPTTWPPVRCPTLVVWALRDPALGAELVAPDRLAPLFAPEVVPRVIHVPDVGHFVQHEAEQVVNEALVDFLAVSSATGGRRRRA